MSQAEDEGATPSLSTTSGAVVQQENTCLADKKRGLDPRTARSAVDHIVAVAPRNTRSSSSQRGGCDSLLLHHIRGSSSGRTWVFDSHDRSSNLLPRSHSRNALLVIAARHASPVRKRAGFESLEGL